MRFEHETKGFRIDTEESNGPYGVKDSHARVYGAPSDDDHFIRWQKEKPDFFPDEGWRLVPDDDDSWYW